MLVKKKGKVVWIKLQKLMMIQQLLLVLKVDTFRFTFTVFFSKSVLYNKNTKLLLFQQMTIFKVAQK